MYFHILLLNISSHTHMKLRYKLLTPGDRLSRRNMITRCRDPAAVMGGKKTAAAVEGCRQ